MDRFIVIHGHFYQPPRENPWLESVEMQDSAYPYHDWNARITAECYGPNARSRILDGEGNIVRIANNYARMSFNVGPTLLKWLEDEEPSIYEAIVDADRESRERFGGHGSAMAQAYNHMIMPLANSRDKRTQVAWGVRDFQQRFGRKPTGMWLPETGVDIESLDIMASFGIEYTVLEPSQAARIRTAGSESWADLDGPADPRRPYVQQLPSGRRISIFFYDGPISRAVAFEGLLSAGETFVNRLGSGFLDEYGGPQLVNIATDGESYGHHHRFGDMALGYALELIEKSGVHRLTNYAEYLALHPDQDEVQIRENTSWSCQHGVERWRSDCGCNTGGNPAWNQEWRAPLRGALDWLRDRLAPLYEQHAARYLRDPWAARDDYIEVIMNREEGGVNDFFATHGVNGFQPEMATPALKLLELQRHAMLMYTSCGWFFDELSRIETTQVIQYAGRAIQLSKELFGDGIEEEFLHLLGQAVSNVPANGTGRDIYERTVRPAVVDLPKLAAHYAVNSLFESQLKKGRVYCYQVTTEDYEKRTTGANQMAIGRGVFQSVITRESEALSFGVVHFGDHNITAGVRPFEGEAALEETRQQAFEAFRSADLPGVIRLLDKHFGELTYSLRSLFRDEQRRVLTTILSAAISEAEAAYRGIFEHHAPLMRFLAEAGIPMPASFQTAAELVINANLHRALEEQPIDADKVASVLADALAWNIELDEAAVAFSAERALERFGDRLERQPEDLQTVRDFAASTAAVKQLPFVVDLWHPQNSFWQVAQAAVPAYSKRAGWGDESAVLWIDSFGELGQRLGIKLPGPD